jgi:molybdopterin-guanine dinucleotide biosynthesis protein MobB
MVAAVTVVGRSGSGKTLLICSLLPVLQAKGYRTATIKHSGHGFQFDQPGKDSHRHYQAGAEAVVLASSAQVVFIKRAERDPTLHELLALLDGYDLVLCEGYKDTPLGPGDRILKIEVMDGGDAETLSDPASLHAVVCDSPVKLDLPRFARDDIEAIADFVCERLFRPD